MALFSARNRDVPRDAFTLTRSEAVKFQLSLIESLTSLSNSWCVRLGGILSAVSVSLSSIYIHNFYRTSVNMLLFRRFTTFVPVVVIPTFSAMALHTRYVRNDIIIEKWACPVCYHVRSSFIQVFFGLLLPGIISPVSAFSFARQYQFCDVPPLNKSGILGFFKEKTKPASRYFALLAVGHTILGIFLAHLEAQQNNNFNLNFEALMKAFDEKHSAYEES